MMFLVLLAQLCICTTRAAGNATSSATVSASTPVQGVYTGPLRPQVHFSPPMNFMNDPNGMFLDASRTYHLYYQYNPSAIVAGDQHWGHATSKDLYHWINQPIAISAPNSSSYAFSGSAVVDVNNTSGFFPSQDDGVVAIFTIDTAEPISLQTQNLAISKDGGYTFELFGGNPVLDIGSSQFRDPQVTWYNDHWVMVVSYASEYVIGVFTSKNLVAWEHASNFSHAGLLGIQYECPNLVEVPVEGSTETMHVLQISINPGAPLGGSISQYFPGSFDGYTFTPVDATARISDFGKDNYAGQFFSGLPAGSEAIQIAWASNWEYSQLVPTGPLEGWRSAMSLPRRQSLRMTPNQGLILTSQPVDLSPVLGARLAAQTLGNGTIGLDYSSVSSNALYFEANASQSVTAGYLNFTFASPVSGEFLQVGLMFGPSQPIWINRGGVRGFENVFFTDKFSTHTVDGITNVAGVIDRSILEVFANRGQLSATNTFFATEPLTQLNIAVSGLQPGNGTVSVLVRGLDSAWQKYENDAGVVVGNTTSGAAMHRRVMYKAGF